MRYLLHAALFSLGLLLGTSWAGIQTHRAKVAEARAFEAEERAGAACEPVYALAYPDGGCAARFTWPPVACAVSVAVYRNADRERVLAKAREIGPRLGVTLYEERGVKERRLELGWNPEVPR